AIDSDVVDLHDVRVHQLRRGVSFALEAEPLFADGVVTDIEDLDGYRPVQVGLEAFVDDADAADADAFEYAILPDPFREGRLLRRTGRSRLGRIRRWWRLHRSAIVAHDSAQLHRFSHMLARRQSPSIVHWLWRFGYCVVTLSPVVADTPLCRMGSS